MLRAPIRGLGKSYCQRDGEEVEDWGGGIDGKSVGGRGMGKR